MKPTGDLIASPLDSINPTSGALSINVPLAALPASNAGMSFALSLIYNSNIYDVDARPDSDYVVRHEIKPNTANGGWSYGIIPQIEEEQRIFSYNDNSCGTAGEQA